MIPDRLRGLYVDHQIRRTPRSVVTAKALAPRERLVPRLSGVTRRNGDRTVYGNKTAYPCWQNAKDNVFSLSRAKFGMAGGRG